MRSSNFNKNKALELSKRGFYLLDDADSTRRKRPWILHIIIDDAVEHLLLILTREWRLDAQERDAELTIEYILDSSLVK